MTLVQASGWFQFKINTKLRVVFCYDKSNLILPWITKLERRDGDFTDFCWSNSFKTYMQAEKDFIERSTIFGVKHEKEMSHLSME